MKYTEMEAGDMIRAVGDDAHKWADAFSEVVPDADRELMFGWFANAIEASHDLRISRLIHDDQAFLDFLDLITSQRRMWQEIRATQGGVQ